MKNQKNNSKGFTIIEVVLVLAIAALIFLMIFVALPALQASQRDTARKNDASLVAASVTKFYSAYKRIPMAWDDRGASSRFKVYLPDLDQYEKSRVTVLSNLGSQLNNDQVYIYPERKCSGTDHVAAGKTNSAVRIQLEDGTFYCVDAT